MTCGDGQALVREGVDRVVRLLKRRRRRIWLKGVRIQTGCGESVSLLGESPLPLTGLDIGPSPLDSND